MENGSETRVTRLDRVIEQWVGYDLPPAGRVLAEAIDAGGWAPDAPDAYCPRCGGSVGRGEVRADGCPACRSASPGCDATVRLGAYRTPLREWVHATKYRTRWVEMAAALGGLLGGAVRAEGGVRRGRTVVVPMAMPAGRRVLRGIDHADLLARSVAAAIGAPSRRILRRGEGPTQAGRGGATRRRLGGREIALRPGAVRAGLEGLDVVLVDDVRTTGATLRRASRRLRALRPRRVVAAVVAVTDPAGRRTAQGARPRLETISQFAIRIG